jgi:hypothetical protein
VFPIYVKGFVPALRDRNKHALAQTDLWNLRISGTASGESPRSLFSEDLHVAIVRLGIH